MPEEESTEGTTGFLPETHLFLRIDPEPGARGIGRPPDPEPALPLSSQVE